MLWRFKVYVNVNGRSDVQDEINGLDDRATEVFKRRLVYLKDEPIDEWKRPAAAKLKGSKGPTKIYEIRFEANNTQHRPLGFFGPQGGEFAIAVWAIEKAPSYNPPDAIDTARRRTDAIRSGQANSQNLKIDGEDFPPPDEE